MAAISQDLLKAYYSNKDLSGDEKFVQEVTEAIVSFQKALPHDHPFREDVSTLKRFLIARRFVIADAHTMLDAHVVWRSKTLPIEMSHSLLEDLKLAKYYGYGKDLNGGPAFVVRSGRFNPKGPNARHLETAVHAVVYITEQLLKDTTADSFSVLYDRADFSISENFDLELIKAVNKVMADNYPERLTGAYVFPSGIVLRQLYKIVSPFLDPRTRTKIHMLPSHKDLAQYFDVSTLEECYGGHGTFDPETAYPSVANGKES
uniref:CRAL-TRIO domain-containing protein n=1 Tax=Chrysotila carterae TaxID=13221 RepID=A0A7S4AYK4_CHRCT|mmetsp:Transcript_55852/g.121624  ORF Transcript_55852/g.121624 Transcript_55852/m.121624 type:complete len:261 (-) Transcript_55852:463-1245(-)